MPELTNADIAWAIGNGWLPYERGALVHRPETSETIFVHESEQNVNPNSISAWVAVIPNPCAGIHRDGWTPWVGMLGALQTDAPFGSVRAALRVAEGLRLARSLRIGEMSCAEEFPEMLALAYLAK